MKLTLKDRQERDKQNTLLRAYGYHWKKYEDLTSEQESEWFHTLCDPEDYFDDPPKWVLLSPLEMPVSDWAVRGWLGERGTSNDDILAFIKEHGFAFAGRDEKHAWLIQSPDGTIINLKQALQTIEQKRIDEAKERVRARKQKLEEDLEKSIASLKETLDLHGSASIYESSVTRLPDGRIKVLTYLMEGEWQVATYDSEEEVVSALHTEDNWGHRYNWEKP